MKAINSRLQHEWQEWTRRKAAELGRVSVQDLDSIGLRDTVDAPDDDTIHGYFFNPTTYAPTALVEIKRGEAIPVDKWRPFAADRANYAALVALARPHSIPVFVVYYMKTERIADDHPFFVQLLESATPTYDGPSCVIKSDTFARLFPRVFGRQRADTPIDRAA